MKKIIIAVLCMGIAFGASAQEKFYNKITASYLPTTFRATEDNISISTSMNAVAVNYLAGFNVGGKNYIETGLTGSYLWKSDNGADFSHIGLIVPVNYTYRFAFKEGKMHLAPFAGIYGRFGIGGNAYDKSSLFKRVQGGVQAGVSFDIKKFYISAGYAFDLTPFQSESGYDAFLSQAVLSIGVTF